MKNTKEIDIRMRFLENLIDYNKLPEYAIFIRKKVKGNRRKELKEQINILYAYSDLKKDTAYKILLYCLKNILYETIKPFSNKELLRDCKSKKIKVIYYLTKLKII